MTDYTEARQAQQAALPPAEKSQNGENEENAGVTPKSLVLTRGRDTNLRQRLRDDADLHYDKLIGSLLEAVEASKLTTYNCRGCGKENRISLPDVKARTQAVQVLIEQGYGKPAQTVTIEQDTLQGLGQLRAWLELMTVEERAVLSGFVDRMTAGATP